MKVTKKMMNTKRHTIGYKIGGKWRSVSEAYSLAKEGKVDGAIACKSGKTGYIQSHPGASAKLTELPIEVRG